jgi:hypothetical protein
MLQVLKNFTHSEKAVASGVCMLAATVMAAMGKMSIAEWQEYSKWILGIYISGKTVQGAAAALTGAKSSDEAARAHERDAKQARKQLDKLKRQLNKNDSAADAALDEKFGDDTMPPEEEDTQPGKKQPAEGE